MNIQELKKTANQVRKNIITEVFYAKAGHPGGSLSAAEIYTYLYMVEMNIDPANPSDPRTNTTSKTARLTANEQSNQQGATSTLHLYKGDYGTVDYKIQIAFAGSYYENHPERVRLMDDIFDRLIEDGEKLLYSVDRDQRAFA